MKILQVITSLRVGGAEKLIVDMVPLYIQAGHQVDVLVFDGVDTTFKQQLIQQGIKIISFGINKSVYSPQFILKLIPLLKQYDIVHTHNTACQYFVAFASLIISPSKRPKLVTTEHNTNNRRRNLWGFKHIDKWMYEKYQSVISISLQATQNLSDFIGSNEKVKTIFNGINIDLFLNAAHLKYERNTDEIILCMVAGFRDQKDQDTLIRSLKYLPKQYKVWLVGDGDRRPILENLVSNEKLADRVHFWGVRSDIPQILKSSDIIVMSSHWEGLSLSSLEGMCVGKPFIASDVDGLHEIVKGYGVLFPHRDEKALAEVALRLSTDKTYHSLIAKRCLERAQQFDIKNTVKQYLDVYSRLIKE